MAAWPRSVVKLRCCLTMPDSLYGARLQGFTVIVFIVAKSRAWFDEYIYHDSLQARAIEGIGHYWFMLLTCTIELCCTQEVWRAC